MADLITQPYLAAALADNQLTTAQTALLAPLTTSASRLIRKFCNRDFSRQIYDELYTVAPFDAFLLRQYPVNAVLRLRSNPTAVISISNTDTVNNQDALAQLATSGNIDTGLVPTGVTLTRWSFGVETITTVLFSALAQPTILALANAIDALGSGWDATILDTSYQYRPVADLRAIQGADQALAPNGASLSLFVTDLPRQVDGEIGLVTITEANTDPFDSIRWGPTMDTSFGDLVVGGFPNNVRVQYDAGIDVVYEDVQQCCVEVVWDMLRLVQRDQRLASESDSIYTYTASQIVQGYGLPPFAQRKLELYRDRRVS